MAQPNTPMLLPRKVQEGIVQYHHQCFNLQAQNLNMRDQMRRMDLAYIREGDQSEEQWRARLANRYGDKSKYQNVTVPVVMPIVEAAVTYQASVFLTGHPIFGVVSNPINMDAALQMETVIEDQATRGGWVREFLLFFRDGFKYNISAIEVSWDRVVTSVLETDLGFSASQARPKEVIWEGNCIRRRDPYNLVFDTRVPATEVYRRGEFAGFTELMSRIELKAFIAKLPDKIVDNIVAAFESGTGFSGNSIATGDGSSWGGYYVPDINPDSLLSIKNKRGDFNWSAWAGIAGQDNKIQYKNMYEVTTLYAKILPSDFGMRVPSPNTPQVWKFIYVNHQILIYAERQTNAHGYLPMLFGQPLEDGLEYQTKSMVANVDPIQEITSALWNANIAARRRAISDRGIYDPSRITEKHINDPNSAAKIPVRPSAYGKPVSEAYYPIPFRDDQSGVAMQDTQVLLQFANVIAGQNPARQGQFVKGNKTLHEFQTVMSNANGRDQVCSMLYESQLFTPLKEIIKVNILQYQGGVSLFNREKEQVVSIDPVALRKAVMDFKVSDGLTPTDKLINGDTLQAALQVIGSSPQIAVAYNIGPLFSYFMKTQGARIQDFEKSSEQLAYEQALGQWQQLTQMVVEAMRGKDPAEVQALIQSLPPQPLPQQFGYNPQQQGAASATPPQEPKVTNTVQNITRNVTRVG
jgi:hypothetical protein